MQEGANYLIGTHDFRNFCKMDVSNGVTEFVRNISQVVIEPFKCAEEKCNSGKNDFSIKFRSVAIYVWYFF